MLSLIKGRQILQCVHIQLHVYIYIPVRIITPRIIIRPTKPPWAYFGAFHPPPINPSLLEKPKK